MQDPTSPPGTADAGSLLPLVYEELRGIAATYLRHERPDHTLQPTALVHEAFVKLQNRAEVGCNGRTHFLALAAIAMRQILVDYARARLAGKRGGGAEHVELTEAMDIPQIRLCDILEIHSALEKLETVDPVGARVVLLRFFGGLTEAEIGEEMGRSERWVRKQWAFARAVLRSQLE